MPPPNKAVARRLEMVFAAGELRIAVGGVWTIADGLASHADTERALVRAGLERVAVAAEGLERADSSLAAWLAGLHDLCEARGLALDLSGLDAGLSRLVALARAVPERTGTDRSPIKLLRLEKVGQHVIHRLRRVDDQIQFLGELGLSFGRLLTGRARIRWRRELRMTRQEIKEEMKEAEGDPFIKARIRALGRQRSSSRMLEKLPGASVVITNPTHYAVALRYAREDGGAPVVVAKGVDHLARRIREIATEHEVPLVENRPLARSLFDQVEVDAQIPPEFYRAVAEIIHYLNNTGRLPRHARPR